MWSLAVHSENMERLNRSVVVSGVPDPDDVLPVTSRMIDILQKHFQRDVEDVEYPTHLNGVAFVTFDNAEDAERVVRQKCHVLRDKDIPVECPLTVFHFTPHVFFYVTNATVNLSEFDGDLEELIQSLRAAHGSVRIRPVLPERRATAEGPFKAIQALREDLIGRANVQHGAERVALREDLIGRANVQHGAERGHSDVDGAVEKNGSVRSSTGSDNKHSPGQRSPTEVGDDVSSTHTRADRNSASHATPDVDSKLPLPKPAYDISLSPAGIENISATPSRHTNSDYMNKRHKTNAKPFGRSSPAAENTLESSKNDRAVAGRPDPTGAGDPGFSQRAVENLHQESIWVDSNTLSYIKQFDMREFDRRLREHGMSLRCDEGDSDLTCVSLSGRPGAEVQSALAHLKHLVEHWQTALRVHVIPFQSMGSPERQWVFKVCDDVHTQVPDVLYTVEVSCVRVIGPSGTSYRFSKLVKEAFEN